MKVEQNKMVGVDYKLTVDGQIADQSRPGQPLEFIFGTGMLLPKFEEAILGKEIGESVAFTLEAKDGYGEVIADAIVDLPKDIFMVDGKLAEDILFEGSQVPMSDAQGNRMMGIVKEVGDATVKMDFNHPMAGKTLNFEVEVVSVRDVTPEATMDACDRNVPGIAEAMRAHSLAITPYAMLSRALCMQRGRHLVINLPGSEKAARENWDGVVKALPHAVKMMAGGGH